MRFCSMVSTLLLIGDSRIISRRIPENSINTIKAHPVVPGSPICGTRIRCGGRLRRAREGIEGLAVIGVSTVPHELKAVELPPACGQTAQGTRKTGKPSPVSEFARQPQMLMN